MSDDHNNKPLPDQGRPDPSLATQQQMDRALKSERMICDTRMDGADQRMDTFDRGLTATDKRFADAQSSSRWVFGIAAIIVIIGLIALLITSRYV
jgi:hypothetical protein